MCTAIQLSFLSNCVQRELCFPASMMIQMSYIWQMNFGRMSQYFRSIIWNKNEFFFAMRKKIRHNLIYLKNIIRFLCFCWISIKFCECLSQISDLKRIIFAWMWIIPGLSILQRHLWAKYTSNFCLNNYFCWGISQFDWNKYFNRIVYWKTIFEFKDTDNLVTNVYLFKKNFDSNILIGESLEDK